MAGGQNPAGRGSVKARPTTPAGAAETAKQRYWLNPANRPVLPHSSVDTCSDLRQRDHLGERKGDVTCLTLAPFPRWWPNAQ
jgi:hypothetical protein